MRRLELTIKNIVRKTELTFCCGFSVAVIGRYGSHLMTVMIFVTQNNSQNGPGISDRLLGFYPVPSKSVPNTLQTVPKELAGMHQRSYNPLGERPVHGLSHSDCRH